MGHRLIEGDCVEAMAAMPEASIDAVVCDPPYGLEFMGKEWDRFAGRPVGATERSDHMNRSDSHGPWGRGDRPINPSTYGRRNEKCLKCDRWRISSNRCQCAEPEWEYRTRGEAAPAMLAFQEWSTEWATQAFRVLKPGGHLLAFGGTRTYHRLACAVEDAGFEIRDTICWLYGSGFPKSLDVSKAIDGVARGEPQGGAKPSSPNHGRFKTQATEGSQPGSTRGATASRIPEAENWRGWGTALKPSHEPIVVARKPLVGTVAGNVLAHSTGALNIDGCRVEGEPDVPGSTPPSSVAGRRSSMAGPMDRVEYDPSKGRWPANVVLDGEAADMLDEQTGDLGKSAGGQIGKTSDQGGEVYEGGWASATKGDPGFGDRGGASRFFYVAKASRAERNAGLDGFEERPSGTMEDDSYAWERECERGRQPRQTTGRNHHPTVKPIALMRWLVRLVTPPGGTVLDPFTGSGTTGCAAVTEGMEFVGVEREAEYVAIARARIELAERDPGAFEPEERARRAAAAAKVAGLPTAEQFGLFDDDEDPDEAVVSG